jgi:hypothetical protein
MGTGRLFKENLRNNKLLIGTTATSQPDGLTIDLSLKILLEEISKALKHSSRRLGATVDQMARRLNQKEGSEGQFTGCLLAVAECQPRKSASGYRFWLNLRR